MWDMALSVLNAVRDEKTQFSLRRIGEAIGMANALQFAVLNKRSDGLWALVEPSKQILERMLQSC